MPPVRISEARSPLSDRALPITLHPSGGHKAVSLVYLALFAACLVNAVYPFPSTLVGLFFRGAIALWALRGLVVNFVYLYPRSTFLKLDSAGFTVCHSFRQRQVRWSAVRRVSTVDVSSRSRVLRVGWQYLPNYLPDGKPIGRLTGWRSQEFDGVLSENYGLKPQDLADFLNQLSDRFSTSDSFQTSDRLNLLEATTAAYSAKALAVLAQPLPVELSTGLANVITVQAIVVGVICWSQFGLVGAWPIILLLSFVVLLYLRPHTNRLNIHRDGFTIHSFLSKETVRWEAIAQFAPEFTRHSSYVTSVRDKKSTKKGGQVR
ncbi:MAG: hypothetical protein DCF25_15090 [Leptolyngbya foveolarum]|uniref:Uncharacterized protein n=1 Tax=Leptolyngbya foveolarum TaxID=47253 RepID=A0A2W4VX47_9CYAN|nr:MAG: hypothetical protein DCF25_15090 [Leptolyngbya foveolarum]